jgi:hypothetical protein
VRRAVAGNRTDLARPQVERDESRVDVADYKRQIADARAILGATDSEMLSDAARRVMDRLAETLIDFDHDRPSPSNDTDR